MDEGVGFIHRQRNYPSLADMVSPTQHQKHKIFSSLLSIKTYSVYSDGVSPLFIVAFFIDVIDGVAMVVRVVGEHLRQDPLFLTILCTHPSCNL